MSKLRPHHLILGFWLLLATAFGRRAWSRPCHRQHDDSPVTREVFGNIPGAWKLVLYTFTAITLAYVGTQFSYRVRNWERGGPDRRDLTAKNAKRRFGDFRAGVYMQTLLRDLAAGIMHSLIYFSFLVLFAVTTIRDQPPGAGIVEVPARRRLQGVLDGGRRRRPRPVRRRRAAIVRRYVQRPTASVSSPGPSTRSSSARSSCSPCRASWPRPTGSPSPAGPTSRFSFVGYLLSQLMDGTGNLAGTRSGGSPTSSASSGSSCCCRSRCSGTCSRRRRTCTCATRDGPRARCGPCPPHGDRAGDLRRRHGRGLHQQLLDTDSCTMCGRCTPSAPPTPPASSSTPARSSSRPVR